MVSAEEPAKTAPPPQKEVQAPAPSVNSVTQAVVKAGALSCTVRVNQVMNFLGSGIQGMGAQVYVPTVEPDRQLISVSLELQSENLPPVYASTAFAPNQANGCAAVYEAVVYWNMKCDDVAAQQFAGLKRLGYMRKDIAALDGGPALKVFLMPAGTGCVSIKKEVVQ